MRKSAAASRCCWRVDDSLGRILAALERKGALDDTVVVFTSDHGYLYGEHGLNEERRLAYEETIRIPLLVRYPRLAAAGSTPGQMALSIDLTPTLLEIAGLQAGAGVQGRSLVPVLRQDAREWRSSFLIGPYTDTVFPRIRNMGYTAARTSRYKYIQYRELRGMDELYDLQDDPYEETNIIDRPEARETLQRMQAECAACWTRRNSRPPRRRPAEDRARFSYCFPKEAVAHSFCKPKGVRPRYLHGRPVAFRAAAK